MKFFSFTLLITLLLTACASSVDVELKEAAEDTPTLEEDVEVLASFQKLETEWQDTLRRGDAELAPTYEEFMFQMGTIEDEFALTITRLEEEGYSVPTEIKDIASRLKTSLMRGDAELAPTYEEAMTEIASLFQEFKTAIDNLEASKQ